MEIWQAIVLGLVQGLTEFLPVSSSAHLLLGQYVLGDPLGGEEGLRRAFDVALHIGTLIALLAYFRADIWQLTRGFFRSVQRRSAVEPEERLPWLIALGTVPAIIVGVLFADSLTWFDDHPVVVAGTLAAFSIAFVVAERTRGERTVEDVGRRSAVAFGCAQALALVPGVSRSGSTIAAGMAMGFDRGAAARFSFLLSVPAVVAAVLHELPEIEHAAGADAQFVVALVVGVVAAAVSGYLAVAALLRFLAGHSLSWFAAYRVPAALAFIVWYVGWGR